MVLEKIGVKNAVQKKMKKSEGEKKLCVKIKNITCIRCKKKKKNFVVHT